MSNKIKCYCKQPFKGLGRSIIGYYKSGDRLIDVGGGRVELHRSDPISITVYVDPVEGTFYLDNIKANREILKTSIIKGHVELEDLELQQEIVGINKVVPHTTIIEHVEKQNVVQVAGVIKKETPQYGNMTTVSKSLDPLLDANLEKYKQKKEEREAKFLENKEKKRIAMAKYHAKKKADKLAETQKKQLPFMDNLGTESQEDADEKELRELLAEEERLIAEGSLASE